MLSRDEIDALTLIKHSLERVGTYLRATDRAENARQGAPFDARSPLTRDLEQCRILLDRVLRSEALASGHWAGCDTNHGPESWCPTTPDSHIEEQNRLLHGAAHQDERPREGACVTYRDPRPWEGTLPDGTRVTIPEPRAAGDLLAHVLDTAGDPARVREHMSDADANDLLARSLTQSGTTEEDAHRVADLYVPITKGTRWMDALPVPAGSDQGMSADRLAERMAYKERVDLIISGNQPDETWKETVARMRARIVHARPEGSRVGVDIVRDVPTPKDVAERTRNGEK